MESKIYCMKKKITKLSFEMVLTNNFISFDKCSLFIYHRPVSNSTKTTVKKPLTFQDSVKPVSKSKSTD